MRRSTFPNQWALFGRFWRPWRPHPSQVVHHGSTAMRTHQLTPERLTTKARCIVCHQSSDGDLPFLASHWRPWRPSQIGASGPGNLEPASEIHQPEPPMNEQRIEILTELIPSDAAYLTRIPRTLRALGVPAEVDIHSYTSHDPQFGWNYVKSFLGCNQPLPCETHETATSSNLFTPQIQAPRSRRHGSADIGAQPEYETMHLGSLSSFERPRRWSHRPPEWRRAGCDKGLREPLLEYPRSRSD